MKQAKHSDRRSFKTWALAGQRTETQDMQKLNLRRRKSRNPFKVGRNNGRHTDEPHAQHGTSQFQLHRRSILSRNSNRFNRHPKGGPVLRPRMSDLRETLGPMPNGFRRYRMEDNGRLTRVF